MVLRLGRLRLRAHRSYAALTLASVFGPALLLAAFAWWSWDRVGREQSDQIMRRVDILEAEGLRLLQVDRLLLQEVDAEVAGMGWDEIERRRGQLDDRLAAAAEQVPEVEAIFLADADGEPQLSSLHGPVAARGAGSGPLVNVRDRSYFIAARGGAPLVIDGPFFSRLTGDPVVNVVRRLGAPDGTFRGIAVVVLSSQRLAFEWRSLAAPGDTVSMVRDDGRILARYPPLARVPGGPRPGIGASVETEFTAAPSGVFDAPPSPLDGIARRIGFRRLADYPIVMVYGVDRANILRAWYPIAAAFGGLATLAAIGLLLAAQAVIRRARGEAEAHARAASTAQALRASEESQRALFRRAPVAMHSLDVERRITDVNDRWLALLGYRRAEVVGRPISEFYSLDDGETPNSRWRELLAQGTLRDAERQCVRRNGTTFEALISATVERALDGVFQRVITTVTDISARRRAEEAARRERRLSDLLIESSAEGIIGKDKALRYTLWNPAMEAMTGVSRDRALGRTAAEVFPGAPGSAAIERAWHDALAGRSTALEDRLVAGREAYYDQTIAPLRDASGAIVGAIAFVRDTTERHRVADVMRQAQKMEAVGQLTGGIAHDFNNLLTVIIGNLEALQRRAGSAELVARFADAAMRGAERAATLTQRLLAFSRRQPLDPKPLDPNRLVTGMSDLLRRALGERVAIETDARRRAVADRRRREPARERAAQSRRQCARCDAGGRQAHDRDRECACSTRITPPPTPMSCPANT